MPKIEIGVVITLVLSIASGALYLGKIDGRLTTIEKNKNHTSLDTKREEAIQLIELAKTESISAIEQSKETLEQDVSNLGSEFNTLSERLKSIGGRKLCYCLNARHSGGSCASFGGWTAYKGDGKTPDQIRIYYCK